MFCRDSFWDSNLTWYTNVPDFTQCFQHTVFILIPHGGFSIACLVYLWFSRKNEGDGYIPHTVLSIAKIVMDLTLLLISVVELSLTVHELFKNINIPVVEICSSCAKVINFILVLVVLKLNRSQGIQSSTLLTVMWFAFTICGIMVYVSLILQAFHKGYSSDLYYKYVLNMLHYPLVFSQFFMSLFREASHIPVKKNPVEDAPFFSFLTFFWFNHYIYKGTKKLLTIDDFPPLPSKLRASYIWERFLHEWQKNSFKRKEGVPSNDAEARKTGLLCVLLKAFWPWFTLALVLHMTSVVLMFAPSLLLDQIIAFMSTKDYVWKGYFYCFVLFVSDLTTRLMMNFTMFYLACFSLQLKSSLTIAVFEKSMKLSSTARKKYTSGEMVNLMSVDVERTSEFSAFATYMFGTPLKIVIAIALLWQYLGPSCLAGVGVLILIVVFTGFISRRMVSIQVKQMAAKDSRLKFLTEMLNGIKVLKLYAWEIPFMKKTSGIRKKEVGLIKLLQIHWAGMSFVWSCGPFLIAVACFVTFMLVDKRNILDPTTAFVSLTLLNILRYAALEAPNIFVSFMQTLVSVKRLNTFLVSEEFDASVIGSKPNDGEAISIDKGTFAWGPDSQSTLKDIDFHVCKGSFVAIIGPVGSGKSSILSAILNDMYKVSGSVNREGTMAYVPQQAWILNQTVKQNILFVSPMKCRKYSSILDNCCLKPDLEIFPAGDNTEIGEKGVNLSGGQKHRVSLARAVYHNADIYLLDDPLSAVDAHVGKHIFEHIIGKNGLLSEKTRILVTHNISVLCEADYIFTMRDGRIEESGTYDCLMGQKGFFFELIQEYANDVGVNDSGVPIDSLAELPDPVNKSVLSERSISTQSSTVSQRKQSVDSATKNPAGQFVEEERMEIGEVKKENIFNYVKYMGFLLAFGSVMGYLGNQAFEVGGNFWLSKWSSDPANTGGEQDVPLRNKRIGVYVALGISQAISIVFGTICRAIGAARASECIHGLMLDSVMKSPMSFFDATPFGRIINRFGHDMDDIDSGIPMQLGGWVACIFSVVGAVVVIGTSTPIFFAFIIPVSVIYYIVQKSYLITSRQLKRLSSTTRSPVYSHFTETIHGASSIKAYNVSKQFLQKCEDKTDINILWQFYWSACGRWLELNLNLIGGLIILIASVSAVSSKGMLDAAVIGLSLTYAFSVNEILNFLVRTGTDLENKSVSVERVSEYSNLPSEAPWVIDESCPPPSWPKHGQIEFKNYSTRYREELELVLKNVDTKIAEGEKIGIIGRTGAGKSSFTLALFRLIEPISGTIDIDNIDVSQIGLHQLRSKLTIIPQDPVLFTGKLRLNLDPNDEYTDAVVWSCLEQASLKNFVMTLTEGLDYELTEGGGNLSLGQKQLICLARALLRKTKILILDEATAAVDVETDALIQNTIRTEFKENTVITIAHRLNTIMDYDRILVMEDGKIAESGSPASLLAKSGSIFHTMARDCGLL